MDNCPSNHDIINVMHVTVELGVKATFTVLADRVDVGSEVLDVEATKSSIGQVEDCVAVDVEDLGWVSGGVDALIITTIDASAHPK